MTPLLSRFSVVQLVQAVGPNVTIEDIDVNVGIELLELQCILNRLVTANPF
jgi:hypothetical protein